jgi:phosphate transport system permease protein
MTDITSSSTNNWSDSASAARRKRRYAAETRLRWYGLAAIGIAIGMLFILMASLVVTGYQSFFQTMIRLPVTASAEYVKADDIDNGNFRVIVRDAMLKLVPGVPASDQRALIQIISTDAPFAIRNRLAADPSLIGQTFTMNIPATDPFDQLYKGVTPRDVPEDQRRVTDKQIAWFDQMVASGAVSYPFNWGLFFNADSRFPEQAGLAGAIVGSFWVLLVCFLISFPMAIAAAVYLEEFAPRNRWTDLIEVNINNLAAVPSIVFGLLGLAVFLQFFGMPRSVPLVGGMVLALMTLPIIIIATRAAISAVPPSIREAALGIGASKHEMILHHVIPLALPGILTGTIIGLAQALGETAPLLLIGMNAFITAPPAGILEASTTLPTQIFIWADSPERGFVARTSAAILVLMMFLIVMNAIAIYLRQRLERTW